MRGSTSTKKWAFDIDGVLADYDRAMSRYVVAVTGRDLISGQELHLQLGWSAYLRGLGYTQAEIDKVWVAQKDDYDFWITMPCAPGRADFSAALPSFVHDDIYFITARKGGKQVTEDWLFGKTGIFTPTVIRTKSKGKVADAIGLDVYIDDRLDLALDVRLESPSTRVYLLDSPSNAYDPIDGITRVRTLAEMFDIELDRSSEVATIALAVDETDYPLQPLVDTGPQ